MGYLSLNINKNQNFKEMKIENRYESVDGDPLKARIYTLDNGLKVYLTSYADAPRVQTNIAVSIYSKQDLSQKYLVGFW